MVSRRSLGVVGTVGMVLGGVGLAGGADAQALPQLDKSPWAAGADGAPSGAAGTTTTSGTTAPATPAAPAASGGWGFPSLPNPFKSSAAPATPAPPPAAVPGQPTVWQSMSAGTAGFVKKTGDFLNPFDEPTTTAVKPAPPPPEVRNLGVNGVTNGSKLKRTPGTTDPAWYDPLGLFTGGEETRPADVNDFLSRRPAWREE